jgi:hypothetical protein
MRFEAPDHNPKNDLEQTEWTMEDDDDPSSSASSSFHYWPGVIPLSPWIMATAGFAVDE